MKIGKTIKTVTSPDRNIRKANEPRKDPRITEPIPVRIPERVPEKVEASQEWRFMHGMNFGRAAGKNSFVVLSATT